MQQFTCELHRELIYHLYEIFSKSSSLDYPKAPPPPQHIFRNEESVAREFDT